MGAERQSCRTAGEGKAFSGDLLENNVHMVKILYCTLGNWWEGKLCYVGFLGFFCYDKKKKWVEQTLRRRLTLNYIKVPGASPEIWQRARVLKTVS